MLLLNVKVGDKLIVSTGNHQCLATVERLTPTRVITNYGTFNKETGKEVGKKSGFFHPYAEVPTSERLHAFMDLQRRRSIISKLMMTNRDQLQTLSSEDLEKIWELWPKATP